MKMALRLETAGAGLSSAHTLPLQSALVHCRLSLHGSLSWRLWGVGVIVGVGVGVAVGCHMCRDRTPSLTRTSQVRPLCRHAQTARLSSWLPAWQKMQHMARGSSVVGADYVTA